MGINNGSANSTGEGVDAYTANSIVNGISLSGLAAPVGNFYVPENGTDFYVTEDGTSRYVIEA